MARARPVPEQIRDWLHDRVSRDGVSATARALDMAEATVARAVGGMDVQAGTNAVLERAHERDVRRAS